MKHFVRVAVEVVGTRYPNPSMNLSRNTHTYILQYQPVCVFIYIKGERRQGSTAHRCAKASNGNGKIRWILAANPSSKSNHRVGSTKLVIIVMEELGIFTFYNGISKWYFVHGKLDY
jgi:hypothetical protein